MVQYDAELARILPFDLPHRERLIEKASQHLHLIASANEYMNLTRIVSPHEAAIKHVYDSVAPWRFFASSGRILDAGTGAGFPGIPLAVVLPEARFILCESTQKKARFVDFVIESLELANVHVRAERAEEVAGKQSDGIIIARALAPMARILDLFRKPLKRGARLMLYKGPNVERELAEAHKNKMRAEIVCRYELPDGLGARTLLQIATSSAEPAWHPKQALASP